MLPNVIPLPPSYPPYPFYSLHSNAHNYDAGMIAIDIDEDVFAHLEQRASGFNKTPNAVLRELLAIDPDSNPFESKKNKPLPELEDKGGSILKLLKSARYLSSNAQEKYLQVLSTIHNDHKNTFGEIVDFNYGERKHFARSIHEIEESGKNTSPRKIPNSSYAALTNLSTKRKRKILSDVMRFFEYEEYLIDEAIRSLPEPKTRNGG